MRLISQKYNLLFIKAIFISVTDLAAYVIGPYLVGVYIPTHAINTVKAALFAAGAGQYQHYDQCCWQTLGQGQFRPLENSTSAIGVKNTVEAVEEIKLELVCSENQLEKVIAALKQSHPYEIPAYHIIKLGN